MPGLAHYKNDPISMNQWEPLYTNLFDVQITLPQLIAGDNADLLVREVTKVSGLEVDKVPPAGVDQMYKGAHRSFSDAIPDSTTLDISMDIQVNLDDSGSAFAYKTLRNWCNLVWDPQTGAMQLKKDYTGGPMVVSVYDRVGKVYSQFTSGPIWPTVNINAMELDYTSGNTIFMIGGFTWRTDYWDHALL